MAAYLPLILFTVATNGFAQSLLKYGMIRHGPVGISPDGIIGSVYSVGTNVFVLFGLFMFVVSMGSHIIVLSKVDLSFAFPFLSLAYVLVAIWSFFFFGESLGFARIAGILLICAGTFFIAKS